MIRAKADWDLKICRKILMRKKNKQNCTSKKRYIFRSKHINLSNVGFPFPVRPFILSFVGISFLHRAFPSQAFVRQEHNSHTDGNIDQRRDRRTACQIEAVADVALAVQHLEIRDAAQLICENCEFVLFLKFL